MFQLQPPEGRYVFQDDDRFPMPVHVWRNHFLSFSLSHNFRAEVDAAFTAMLQRVRVGRMTVSDIACLRGRVGLQPPDEAVRLRARRKDVKRYNKSKLAKLPGKEKLEAEDYILRGGVWKPDPKHYFAPENEEDCCGLPKSLLLAPGAEVILRSNVNTMDGLTNGAKGTVVEILKGPEVLVRFDNPSVGSLSRAFAGRTDGLTSILPVTKEFQGRCSTPVCRTQVPLQLAWAITIHKAQGKTLSGVEAQLDKTAAHPGSAYVALSRVRRLKDLFLSCFDPSCLIPAKGVNEEMERLKNFTLSRLYRRSLPHSAAVCEELRILAGMTYTQDDLAKFGMGSGPTSSTMDPEEEWVTIGPGPSLADHPPEQAFAPTLMQSSRSTLKRKRPAPVQASVAAPVAPPLRARRVLFPEEPVESVQTEVPVEVEFDEYNPILPVVGDGRCLFRALVRQLYGNFYGPRDCFGKAMDKAVERAERAAADKLRDEVCDYMEDNIPLLQTIVGEEGIFGTESPESYIAAMRVRTVWGGTSEAFVVHELTGRAIRVWKRYATAPYFRVMQNFGEVTNAARNVLDVIWVSESHYNIFLPAVAFRGDFPEC